MYTIKSDGNVIHAPSVSNQGYKVTNPKLTMEVNKAGSLEFSIPPTNPAYNGYSKLKSIITVEQDGEEIWRGRVLDDTKDFYNNKKVTCEGELAFLNDVLIRPSEYNGVSGLHNIFRMLINKYSSVASTYRNIKPGNITMDDTSMSVKIEQTSNVMNELIEQLLNRFGGYLFLRRSNGVSYLDYVNSFSSISSQEIRFGENMLDIEEFIDASKVYTIMVPYGKKNDDGSRVTIASANNGQDWIQSNQAIELFGVIEQTVTWEDIEDPSQLFAEANALMNDTINTATTITIKALDLHLLNIDTEAIKVGQLIPVVSLPHGIDARFLCSKIVLYLLAPENNEYTLGLPLNTLTDQQVSANKQSEYAYDSSKSTASSSVSRSEFNGVIRQIQEDIDAISIPELSDYATKKDLEDYAKTADLNGYVKQINFDLLEQRVLALENKEN